MHSLAENILYDLRFALRGLARNPGFAVTAVLAATLAIFGFFDVPFVYLSIRIFRTQHPQPVMGGGENSGLDPTMAPLKNVCEDATIQA